MRDKILVTATETITYECECPECGETMYSQYNDNWNIHEMIHYPQEVKCEECGCEFLVTI